MPIWCLPLVLSWLGSPLGDHACTSAVLADKVEALRCLGDRLKFLSAHDALILLRNCFALPKLMYVLHTAPCFQSSTLESYDDCLRETLGSLSKCYNGWNHFVKNIIIYLTHNKCFLTSSLYVVFFEFTFTNCSHHWGQCCSHCYST